MVNKSLHIIIRIFVYSSAFYFFSHITADTDLWGHIKFGQDLWMSGRFPRLDIYSYTAQGSTWVNHEWLSEIIMFLIFHALGSKGLLLAKLLVGFALLYILSRISFKRTYHPMAYGIVFTLSAFVISPGFMTRPQILTFLFSGIFLLIFELYLEKGKQYLWLLPLLMVLWVNGHGGFLVGVGVSAVIVIVETITCVFKNSERGHIRQLLLWSFLTILAVLVNPYGHRLIVFLWESLGTSRPIGEWQPVTLTDLSYFRFKILAFLFLVSLVLRKGKIRYWEIAIISVSLLYAIKHQRHTAIFAIFVCPYLTEFLSLQFSHAKLLQKIKTPFGHVALGLSILLLIGYQGYVTVKRYASSDFQIIVDPKKYPVHAVRFLKENQIAGNVLLPFEWGEYVIWKRYPESKVSIDGRFRTVYPEEVLQDHFEALRSDSHWVSLMKKYPTDIILVKRSPFFQNMIKGQRDWIYIYSDALCMIFIKKSETYQHIIDKMRNKDLVYPDKRLSLFFP